MSVLHLVRTSNFIKNDLAMCLSHIDALDTLVLLDDGCYNLKHPLLNNAIENSSLHNIGIIEQHAHARGLNVKDGIELMTMEDIVGLVFKHQSVITWQ